MCGELNCRAISVCECSFCAKALCTQHQAVTPAGNPLMVCDACKRRYQTTYSQGGVPPALAAEHALWVGQGRPAQFASPLDVDLWGSYFPTVPALLAACRVVHCRHGRTWTMIDRRCATRFGDQAYTSPQAAVDAHFVSMMWGLGKDGRGPWRMGFQLATPGAPASLQAAAQTLRTSGIVAAFNSFVPRGSRGRLDKLGSAFSTKDLFFFSNVPGRHRALIFDSIVATWLATNLNWRIPAGTENVTDYCRYLYAMYSWAADLGESPEDTEVVMFGWVPNARWSPC